MLAMNRVSGLIKVDRSSPVPLYFQVAQRLEELIESGEMPPGHQLENEISLADLPAPDEVAVALRLPEGAPVMAIERLRYAQDEPLALMHNYLPPGIADITPERLTNSGLYQILRAAGIQIRIADQTISARRATPTETRLLHEVRGAPLLAMSRTAYDHSGRAVEYGSHVYRASRYSFELTLVSR